VVDDFVVMDAGNDKCRRVVFACLFYALLLRLFRVPSSCLGSILFGLGNEAEELNVSRREEIPSSVNVNDDLARSHSLAFYKLVELALFFLDRVLAVGLLSSHPGALIMYRVAGCRSP
jgi:hypothetical protein